MLQLFDDIPVISCQDISSPRCITLQNNVCNLRHPTRCHADTTLYTIATSHRGLMLERLNDINITPPTHRHCESL